MATSEAQRLEQLWAGEFGDEYVARNLDAYGRRGGFWGPLIRELAPASVLEVGCNVGGNLQWIAAEIGASRCYGVDVNEKALEILQERLPGVHATRVAAREMPYPDRSIDLVFTQGVLIHQPEESLGAVMDEMVRVARRFVLCGEYFDRDTTEVPYRGHAGALFRRDYGRLFAERFPDSLRLVRQGFLGRDDGWDDVTWWLFERV
jgi:pseudaminic acid biosynthesis-associated methylase